MRHEMGFGSRPCHALSPDADAYKAIGPGMGEFHVAWPFTPCRGGAG